MTKAQAVEKLFALIEGINAAGGFKKVAQLQDCLDALEVLARVADVELSVGGVVKKEENAGI